MRKMYNMKVLAWMGSVVLASVLAFLLLAWLIPPFKAPEPSRQLFTIRHQELRDNNPLYTDLFLQSIKHNNGYLVLGTSESNNLTEGNYYDFLNADTALNIGFSVVAGAGRTPCTYFPLIQSNENVRGLKVIFTINPRYWCTPYARSNKHYFGRYVSTAEYKRANRSKNKLVNDILKINRPHVPLVNRIGDGMCLFLDRLRRKYYQDLVFDLKPDKFCRSLHYLERQKRLDEYPGFGKLDSTQYDFEHNVAKGYNVNENIFAVDTSVTYRYDELRAMISVCKEHGVDITFVVGPYNKLAFEKASPGEVPLLDEVCHHIMDLCRQENVPYIDATDMSDMPGVFKDIQHHNSYGAYFIYLKIKDYVLEKENR